MVCVDSCVKSMLLSWEAFAVGGDWSLLGCVNGENALLAPPSPNVRRRRSVVGSLLANVCATEGESSMVEEEEDKRLPLLLLLCKAAAAAGTKESVAATEVALVATVVAV